MTVTGGCAFLEFQMRGKLWSGATRCFPLGNMEVVKPSLVLLLVRPAPSSRGRENYIYICLDPMTPSSQEILPFWAGCLGSQMTTVRTRAAQSPDCSASPRPAHLLPTGRRIWDGRSWSQHIMMPWPLAPRVQSLFFCPGAVPIMGLGVGPGLVLTGPPVSPLPFPDPLALPLRQAVYRYGGPALGVSLPLCSDHCFRVLSQRVGSVS